MLRIQMIMLLTLKFLALNAQEKLLMQENFEGFKAGSELQAIEPSGTPRFPLALKLMSRKSAEGKIMAAQRQPPAFNARAADFIEIEFFIKIDDDKSSNGIIVNDRGSRIIHLGQDGGFFRVARSLSRDWINIAPVRFGEWHHFRYRIDCLRQTYEIFLDDGKEPVYRAEQYQNNNAVFPDRIWTVANGRAESTTWIGAVKVTAISEEKFPPAGILAAPYHLYNADMTKGRPEIDDFAMAQKIVLNPANGLSREKSTVKVLRCSKNLYCLFTFDAADMQKRDQLHEKFFDNDIWEIFLRPDLESDTYYHFAGDSHGGKYCSRRTAQKIDTSWQGKAWSVVTTRTGNGWRALVEIPFSELGNPPRNIWGANFARENPWVIHGKEVSSWTQARTFHNPERFGHMAFIVDRLNPNRTRESKLHELLKLNCQSERQMDLIAAILEIPKHAVLPDMLKQTAASLQNELRTLKNNYGRQASFPHYVRNVEELRNLKVKAELFRQDLDGMMSIFTPGSEAEKRRYAVTILNGAQKLTDITRGVFQSVKPRLLLSGRETGSFQLLLQTLPGHLFSEVSIETSPLRDASGQTLPGSKTIAYRVSFIQTAIPDKAPLQCGDLLIPGNRFCFKNESRAAFFVDFYLPPETPAGEYETDIRLTPEGFEPFSQKVTIRATGLSLPPSASLDTAFCYDYRWSEEFYREKISAEQLIRHSQFILDHRLEPMNLWLRTDYDIGREALDYCAKNGKTMLFVRIHPDQKAKKAEIEELIGRYPNLRPIFYGYDEVLLSKIPGILDRMKHDFALNKEIFPQYPRHCTVSIDSRLYGYVDVWCPLFDRFNPELAEERIKKGETVWWYNTDYPLEPYANFNLDSHGIDPRIIPWMNWKLNISGLLHWGINNGWRNNSSNEYSNITMEFARRRSMDWITPEVLKKAKAGTTRFPEIPWIPYFRDTITKLVSETNGGGNLMYPGPDWEPWPSFRLKNLRDGMQDYEYLVMLKNNIDALKGTTGNDALIEAAEKLVAIDNAIVKDATSYTKDIETLLRFREKIIEKILKTNAAVLAGK